MVFGLKNIAKCAMLMMWLFFLCFPLMLVEVSTYRQNDYTITSEIIEFGKYNRSLLIDPWLRLVHYNRTYRAINGSAYLRKDFNMNIIMWIQFYKFLSNEYRFFPLTMKLDLCKELQRDALGFRDSLQKSVNVGVHCPFKRGLMTVTYAMLNYSHFPPYIPGGRYKINVNVSEGSDFIGEMIYYAKIEEVLKKWEN